MPSKLEIGFGPEVPFEEVCFGVALAGIGRVGGRISKHYKATSVDLSPKLTLFGLTFISETDRDRLRRQSEQSKGAQYHETSRAGHHDLSCTSGLVLSSLGTGWRHSLQKALRCLSRSSKPADSSAQRAPEDARKSNTPNDGLRIDDEHRLSPSARGTRSHCKFPGN